MGEQALARKEDKWLVHREAKARKKQQKCLSKGKYRDYVFETVQWISELNSRQLEYHADRALGDLISLCESQTRIVLDEKRVLNWYPGFATLGEFVFPLGLIRDFFRSYYAARRSLPGDETVAHEVSCALSIAGETLARGRNFGLVRLLQEIDQYYQFVGRLLVTATRVVALYSPAVVRFVTKGGSLDDQKLKVLRVMPILLTSEFPKTSVTALEFGKVKLKGLKTVRFRLGEDLLDVLVEDEMQYPGMRLTMREPDDPTEARLVFTGTNFSLALKRELQKGFYSSLKACGWAS